MTGDREYKRVPKRPARSVRDDDLDHREHGLALGLRNGEIELSDGKSLGVK